MDFNPTNHIDISPTKTRTREIGLQLTSWTRFSSLGHHRHVTGEATNHLLSVGGLTHIRTHPTVDPSCLQFFLLRNPEKSQAQLAKGPFDTTKEKVISKNTDLFLILWKIATSLQLSKYPNKKGQSLHQSISKYCNKPFLPLDPHPTGAKYRGMPRKVEVLHGSRLLGKTRETVRPRTFFTVHDSWQYHGKTWEKLVISWWFYGILNGI